MDLLPTHPTPEMTHAVETILDYGCDWTYIVENNLVSKTDPHPNPNPTPHPNPNPNPNPDPNPNPNPTLAPTLALPLTRRAAHSSCARARRGVILSWPSCCAAAPTRI